MGKLFNGQGNEGRRPARPRVAKPAQENYRPRPKESSQLVYGIRPIMEAVEAGKQFERVYVQKGVESRLLTELVSRLNAVEAPVQYVPVEKLNRLTSNVHQGVVALLAPIAYRQVVSLLPALMERAQVPLVLMLDRITDVRNMGAIARTAECAGVDAMILPAHGSAQLNEDAMKTSAGALFRLPVCREQNLKTVVNLCKQLGMQVVAATEKSSTNYLSVDFRQPTLLIMGAEDTGISPELLRLCDVRARLPMCGSIQSLNVSVAAGVFMYEVLRQRAQQ
ncbi:MAG: 23S rRNA (guanosine(2251)-2'-O)-methyltransferase RlmB [Bacteroidales bacterium]|nr:23S rRNA (guanosine(2251)-2'-O)-methyltransferase RlmB [Bacteroidales bacterium]